MHPNVLVLRTIFSVEGYIILPDRPYFQVKKLQDNLESAEEKERETDLGRSFRDFEKAVGRSVVAISAGGFFCITKEYTTTVSII